MWLPAEQSASGTCAVSTSRLPHTSLCAQFFVWRVHQHLLDVNLPMHHSALKDSNDTLGAALLQRSYII